MGLSVRSFIRSDVRPSRFVGLCEFLDKPLKVLISNLVYEFIIAQYSPGMTGQAPLDFSCFLPSDWSSSFCAFEKKRWSDLSQIWWANPDLINFWIRCSEFSPFPGIWFVEHFLRISKQTTDRVAIKFGGPNPFGSPSAWLTFDHAPLNSLRFLASVFFNSFRAIADKPLIRLSSNLVGQLVMGLSQLD